MSCGFPIELIKQIETRVAVAAHRRVARCFVPGYNTAAAIRLTPSNPRRALARRQLARLIEPRRVVS
jgi:hypothetical protein